MNTITINKFISDVRKYHNLTERQQKNVKEINKISKIFSSRARINIPIFDDLSSDSVIIETGHQPNFLPYSGMWKKAFLIGRIQKKLTESDVNTCAYFGFADQNLSTAKILSKNLIPFWNKKGNESIGFRIEEEDRFKPFCKIEKPSRNQWEKEMNRIAGFYLANTNKFSNDRSQEKLTIDTIINILWECYEASRTFSELNSTIFAKICYEILGFDNILFFSFSDVTREKIFIDECKQIILRYNEYNQIFNRTIANKNLGLRTITPNRIPFWFHCECGGKLDLNVHNSGEWVGLCPLCRKEHTLNVGTNLELLDTFYSRMDFTAVARNIVFAMGMGSSLFLSGSGGALSYGIISDEISKELSFYRPRTLSWRSRDYYFGIFHKLAIQELIKIFNISFSEISDGSFSKEIASLISDAELKIIDAKKKSDNEKNLKRLENTKNNLVNVSLSTAHLFQIQPSFIDLLTSADASTIINKWNTAVEEGTVEFDDVGYKIRKDVIHPTYYLREVKYEEILTFYKQIESIEVK
jgi:hypothetical protein